MDDSKSSPTAFTVLVADDDPDMRGLLRSFLESWPGLRVLEASDGVEAVAILMREAIDLAILDLNMPRMNGLEVASVVRGGPRANETTLVMFTTDKDVHTRRKAMAQGIRYYVNKPFNPVEFNRILEGILDKGARSI